jgi:hypothetical protein
MSARSFFILSILAVAVGSVTKPAFAACDENVLRIGFGACHHECIVKNKACEGLKSALNGGNLVNIHAEFSTCINAAPLNVRQNVEACFTGGPEEKKMLITEGCLEFGCTAPQPTRKSVEFDNQPMTPVSAAKDVVVADFSLPGDGDFSEVTLDFRRDNENLFDLSTYAVSFDHADGKLHLRVTTYDRKVNDVHDHKYTVTGTLYVMSR